MGPRVFSPRICQKCRKSYVPTGTKQRFCAVCVEKVPAHKKVGKARVAIDLAPESIDDVPAWLLNAPWKLVESAWVALMVEQFGTDGNRGAMALALCRIRDRYRERSGCSGTEAPQVVE